MAGGADLHATDYMEQTALNYAADSRKVAVLAFLMNAAAGHILELENIFGETVYSLAIRCFDFHSTAVLNLAPRCAAYDGQKSNVLTSAVRNRTMTTKGLRMVFRRLSEELLKPLLTRRALIGGTPLYAACTVARPDLQCDFITLLLDAGADLEGDGGDYGTPLMGACAAGRLSAVTA